MLRSSTARFLDFVIRPARISYPCIGPHGSGYTPAKRRIKSRDPGICAGPDDPGENVRVLLLISWMQMQVNPEPLTEIGP